MSEEWLHRIFGMGFLSCVVLLATWDNAFSFAFFCFIFCEKISLLFTFLNAFRKLQLLHDSSLLASSISLRLCADKRENFFRLQIKGWTVDLEAWTLSLRFSKAFSGTIMLNNVYAYLRSKRAVCSSARFNVGLKAKTRQRLRVSSVPDLIRVEFIINFIIIGSSNIFFTSHTQTIVATLLVEKQKLLWASKFSLSLNYCFVPCVVIAKDGSRITVRCCHLAVNLFII